MLIFALFLPYRSVLADDVVGTGDGFELLREVATAYNKTAAGANIQIPPSIGSGGAIAAVGSGHALMGRVARDLSANERALGISYHPVFEVPSVFYVHPSVSVHSLTQLQLAKVFAGEITSWKELGGADIKIRVVRRESSDSTLLSLRAAYPEFGKMNFTERSKVATTTQEAMNDIQENVGAIGFGPYSNTYKTRLNVLHVDNLSPQDPRYPAQTRLALIYKNDKLTPSLRSFLSYFGHNDAIRMIQNYGARSVYHEYSY